MLLFSAFELMYNSTYMQKGPTKKKKRHLTVEANYCKFNNLIGFQPSFQYKLEYQKAAV